MNLTFVCQSCDDAFELDYSQLIEESKGRRCPNCSKKLPAAELDELVTTLDDLLGQIAALRKRFVISFDVDAEDLPPPHDVDNKKSAAATDDDEEEEDDDDDADDEDLGADADEDL